MLSHEAFNRSAFARFVNSPRGRVARLLAGATFLGLGNRYRERTLGRVAMGWSALPLSAAAFDLCFVSALLGGPLSGAKIRAMTSPEAPGTAAASPSTLSSPAVERSGTAPAP